MLSCTIDAMEQRFVAKVNIPSDLIQADIDDEVESLDPTFYRKFVQVV